MSEKKIFSYSDPEIKSNKNDLARRWYVSYNEVYANGVKRPMKIYGQINRKKTVAERMKAAKELLQKVLEDLQQQYIDSTPQLERVMIAQVVEITRSRNDCDKTRQCYESKVRMFCRWCIGQNKSHLLQLSNETVKAFFHYLQHGRKLNGNTYNDYRFLFKAIFKRLDKEFLMSEIQKMRESPQSALMFQQHQQEMIVEYLSQHDPLLLLFVQFMFYTLQRPGREMPLMKVSDIELDNSRIHVDPERAKNRREAWVTIPNQLREIIKQSRIMRNPQHFYVFGANGPSEKPTGRDHWSKRHKKVLEVLGFGKGYNMYSWNHTGALSLFKATNNIIAVMHQKRHTSLAYTYRYTHQVGDDQVRTEYPTLGM